MEIFWGKHICMCVNETQCNVGLCSIPRKMTMQMSLTEESTRVNNKNLMALVAGSVVTLRLSYSFWSFWLKSSDAIVYLWYFKFSVENSLCTFLVLRTRMQVEIFINFPFQFQFSFIMKLKMSCSSSLLKEGAAAFASSALLLNNGTSVGWSRYKHKYTKTNWQLQR